MSARAALGEREARTCEECLVRRSLLDCLRCVAVGDARGRPFRSVFVMRTL